MKKGYYVFDPVIYPRKLYVMIGQTQETANKLFRLNGSDETIKMEKTDVGKAYSEVATIRGNWVGALLLFGSKASMSASVIAHEASHACDFIEDAIGMEHGDEASAYLIGWIVKCVDEARKGKGEFVELKKTDDRA
jgi:hypothetical protein